MNFDVIIIGNGLIGSMAAKHFRNNGYEVGIIDSTKPMAASKCSFGVWKDGWVSDKIKQKVEDGKDLLEAVCDGIDEVEFFDTKKEVIVKMSRVDCSKIIEAADIPGDVIAVKDKTVIFMLDGEKFELTAKKAVIIAAGGYTDYILASSKYPVIGIDQYWGATLNVKIPIDQSRIFEWAPYKQSVLLQTNFGFVFGDGASVKNPKPSDKRIEKVSDRLLVHMNDIVGTTVNNDKIIAVNEGWRPYLPASKTEHVNKHDKNLFSATGGAKNTTILCGAIAKELFTLVIKNSQ